MGVSGQHHASATLYPGERTPGTHWLGSWVGPRAGLNAEARGKILCRGSNPGRPIRSQALYWLNYPGSSRESIRPNISGCSFREFTLQRRIVFFISLFTTIVTCQMTSGVNTTSLNKSTRIRLWTCGTNTTWQPRSSMNVVRRHSQADVVHSAMISKDCKTDHILSDMLASQLL
jgi:hypothetical protein